LASDDIGFEVRLDDDDDDDDPAASVVSVSSVCSALSVVSVLLVCSARSVCSASVEPSPPRSGSRRLPLLPLVWLKTNLPLVWLKTNLPLVWLWPLALATRQTAPRLGFDDIDEIDEIEHEETTTCGAPAGHAGDAPRHRI
jgi:hypothetical protein